MRFCFVVLFVCTVSKSYAEDLQYRGFRQKSLWQTGSEEIFSCPAVSTPTVSISLDEEIGWGENNVYPVQVCPTLTGRIDACSQSEKSYIRLILYHPDANPKFEVNLTEKFTLKGIRSGKEDYCVVFKASNISTACAHQNLKEIRVKAEVVLFANPPMKTDEAFSILLRAAPHLLNYPGEQLLSNRNLEHTLHSVVCTIPNCAVAATQPAIDPSMTERFTIREGKAPKYEEGDGPLTDKMFSVTYFECEPGKCPTFYTATNVTKTATDATTTTTTTAATDATMAIGATNDTIRASENATSPSLTNKGGVLVGLLLGGGLGVLILLPAVLCCAAFTAHHVHRQHPPQALLSVLTWEFPEAYTGDRGASIDREDLVRNVSQ